MVPNRIIKESICTSENINNLSTEAEILFYRLMVQCDDYGIFFAAAPIVKSKCFPWKTDKIKDKDIDIWLYELQEAKLIFLYEFDSKRYLKFVKWEKHQQKRANKSKYPTLDSVGAISILIDSNGNQLIANVPENRESRIENRESRQGIGDNIPCEEIKNQFNTICQSLSKVVSLSKSRKEKIKVRWNEWGSIEKAIEIFTAVKDTPFLCGNNERGWKCSFDWLIENDKNYIKVLEGVYKKHDNTIDW